MAPFIIFLLFIGAGLTRGHSAPSDTVAGPPLEAPESLILPDASFCTPQNLIAVTSKFDKEILHYLSHGDPLDEPSCKILAESYGHLSKEPTANCFCMAEYWNGLITLAEQTYISWATIMDTCQSYGYHLYYYMEGEGPCGAGGLEVVAAPESEEAMAPGPSAEVEVAAEEEEVPPVLPMRTFSKWVSGLNDFPWGATCFAFAIMSLPGIAIITWYNSVDIFFSIKEKFA